MKFRYYVTNLFNGCIEGTNDEEKASEMAECEDFFVVDSETGIWMSSGGKEEIKEI